MEDDREWEDAAFNTRHLHNRNDKRGYSARHEFDVRSTFGTHLVKCTALDRLREEKSPGQDGGGNGGGAKSKSASGKGTSGSSNKKTSRSNSNGASAGDAILEMYRLADGEEGILGSLRCAGVFEATVVFAGSRKTLSKITRHLGRSDLEGAASSSSSSLPIRRDGSARVSGHTAENGEDDDEEDDSDDDEPSSGDDTDGGGSREKRQRKRIATFEKNSFRQPKFWFRWQGDVDDDTGAAVKANGSGYIVFSGNDCKRFQGTMTSEKLGWNNVKMNGFKTKPQPERDFEICWNGDN